MNLLLVVIGMERKCQFKSKLLGMRVYIYMSSDTTKTSFKVIKKYEDMDVLKLTGKATI